MDEDNPGHRKSQCEEGGVFSEKISQSLQFAIIKGHRLIMANSRNLFLKVLEAGKSRLKALTHLMFHEDFIT